MLAFFIHSSFQTKLNRSQTLILFLLNYIFQALFSLPLSFFPLSLSLSLFFLFLSPYGVRPCRSLCLCGCGFGGNGAALGSTGSTMAWSGIASRMRLLRPRPPVSASVLGESQNLKN